MPTRSRYHDRTPFLAASCLQEKERGWGLFSRVVYKNSSTFIVVISMDFAAIHSWNFKFTPQLCHLGQVIHILWSSETLCSKRMMMDILYHLTLWGFHKTRHRSPVSFIFHVEHMKTVSMTPLDHASQSVVLSYHIHPPQLPQNFCGWYRISFHKEPWWCVGIKMF